LGNESQKTDFAEIQQKDGVTKIFYPIDAFEWCFG